MPRIRALPAVYLLFIAPFMPARRRAIADCGSRTGRQRMPAGSDDRPDRQAPRSCGMSHHALWTRFTRNCAQATPMTVVAVGSEPARASRRTRADPAPASWRPTASMRPKFEFVAPEKLAIASAPPIQVVTSLLRVLCVLCARLKPRRAESEKPRTRGRAGLR